jgi:hypothetical protein
MVGKDEKVLAALRGTALIMADSLASRARPRRATVKGVVVDGVC